MKTDSTKIGIVGCGTISRAYARGLSIFPEVELTACADIIPEAAQRLAQEWHLEALSVEELLASEIGIVVNLTLPQTHAEVTCQALRAGKHVYSEKPLAVSLPEARLIAETAVRQHRLVACAPDTFLGAGQQTCRKLIDDGWVGDPLSATAFLMIPGHESWHPNPAFYYQTGAGPMLDMGPYYITALVHLLGPVAAVTALTTRGFAQRVATCEKRFGESIPVECPTHYSGLLSFLSGATAVMVMSFDVRRHGHHPIEIYGSRGSLQVPDPNKFADPVRLARERGEDWREVPYSHGFFHNHRGLGVWDLAMAIREGRSPRCSQALATHVLEVMLAFETSAQLGGMATVSSRVERPLPMPQKMPLVRPWPEK